jgi:hypothetical protein
VFYSTPLVATADNTVFYSVIAGRLPPGIQIDQTGVLAGLPQAFSEVQGVPQAVVNDTTSQFDVRAYTKTTVGGVTVITGLADRTFTITVTGQSTVTWTTSAGLVLTEFDGSQIEPLTLVYSDPDPNSINTVSLIAGALPPGLTVSDQGVITGYITPNPAATQTTSTYSFTLRVTNGVSADVRTFSILVYARSWMTADNTQVTADNTFVTADASPVQNPIITTPTGSIGSTRSDNFFAFQFQGAYYDGDPIEFEATTVLPPGLTLDPVSGWLYGLIPFEGIVTNTYDFSLIVRDALVPSAVSADYDFSLTVTGPVNSDVIWLTPANLGTIDNGATSTFYVAAENVAGLALQYQLKAGSDSSLPQGLQLLPSGHIAGRVSFNTFAVDGGTTTFDVGLNTVDQPTTFDMVNTFTVTATSINGLVNVDKTFSITVIRRYDQPFDNLYIQAMPPQQDRDILASLLQDPTIFPPDLIYRSDDPNFGVARRVIYNHAYGLVAATLDDYVASLDLNHYWKNLVLGEIKTAQALDDAGNVIYEVVYSAIQDNLVNNDGESVDKQVVLAFPINEDDSTQIDSVYPNSLINMRDQVIDTVGQVSRVLPRWMLSRQANGAVLGFTPAWVIAYVKPGQGGQIAYNIQTQFADQLNLIDFKVDRYELDNFLTKNWDRENQHWGIYDVPLTPYPPSLTTFDIFGLPPFDPSTAYPVGATVIYQQVVFTPAPDNQPAYRLSKPYRCILTTTPGILPTNTTYWESNNTSGLATWINNNAVITTWEDNFGTLATWTYSTPPGTTFDGGSMQFTAPVDMYSGDNSTTTNTTEYDKYLLFPKRNIIDPVVRIDTSQIYWTNDYNQFLNWVNNADQSLIWTNT